MIFLLTLIDRYTEMDIQKDLSVKKKNNVFAENIYFIYKATIQHYIRKLLQYFCLGIRYREIDRQNDETNWFFHTFCLLSSDKPNFYTCGGFTLCDYPINPNLTWLIVYNKHKKIPPSTVLKKVLSKNATSRKKGINGKNKLKIFSMKKEQNIDD